MKRVKQQKKGISLIVLVITIIVMIILAAAIILSLDGSNIIERAKTAQSASDIATAREIVALAKSEWAFEKVDGYDSAIEYAEAKLEEAGYKVGENGGIVLSETSTGINTLYIGSDNRQTIIPEGFTVSSVSTEDTVTEGLVIIDSEGNEFVWVPVDDFTKFERTTLYDGTIVEPDSFYKEPGLEGFDGSDIVMLSLENDLTGEWAEWTSMRTSVEEYKGFYIARYEAGKEGIDTVVSKKGATVWNEISWGYSSVLSEEKEAVYYSRQMYKGSKSVVSTLCYGVQWDAALQFISINDADYAIKSDGKGNYTGSLLPTGSSEEYAVNNIYDMAGNVWEWTMEATNQFYHRVIRGGSFSNVYGTSNPASYRDYDPDGEFDNYGFRVALYLK